MVVRCFATLAQNFKAIPSASPKLLNFNQDHPSKKVVFLVKSLLSRGYDNFSLSDHVYNIT